MVKIVKEAIAGTLESSDVMVRIVPAESAGLSITVNSIVFKQFGEQIYHITQQTLLQMGVTDIQIDIDDKGALECVLKARIQAAVMRAADHQTLLWEVL